jgi:hypothetical protein
MGLGADKVSNRLGKLTLSRRLIPATIFMPAFSTTDQWHVGDVPIEGAEHRFSGNVDGVSFRLPSILRVIRVVSSLPVLPRFQAVEHRSGRRHSSLPVGA